MKKIALIILASGASTRMNNQIKQLLPWKKSTLLEHTIGEALASNADAVFVVLGANIEIIRSELTPNNYKVIENSNWSLGIGNSIATAIKFLNAQESNFDAALIVLVDQPLLDSAYYNKIISIFKKSEKSIVATAYQNKNGVPAIFDKIHFETLAKLNKDYGAMQIIKNTDAEVVNPNNKFYDIDTLEDYHTLLTKLKHTE